MPESVFTDKPGDDASEDILYPSSSVTHMEMVVLLNTYIFRHYISKEGAEDLLTIAKFLVPKGRSGCIPSSYYKLKRELNIDIAGAKKHYFCQRCCKI